MSRSTSAPLRSVESLSLMSDRRECRLAFENRRVALLPFLIGRVGTLAN
jgi:hypothetical protein